MCSTFCCFIYFATIVTLGLSSKILVVYPTGAYSHHSLGLKLSQELANRGHEVTFITAYTQKTPIKNLREISVVEIMKNVNERKKEFFDFGTMSYIKQLLWVSRFGSAYTEDVLRVKAVQELLKSNEKFDLVIFGHFMNEALFIFQYKFNCPLIIMAPGPTTIFNNHFFANPPHSAYVPNLLANFGPHMSLWQRLTNFYYDVIGELIVHFDVIPRQNEVLQRTVPGSPNLEDIMYNASFMFLTSHISIREPCPLQPNIKEIGGFHISPPKPLPTHIKEFLDNATEGAIVFSMGSNLNSSSFPQQKKQDILKVFSRLKQKVLWKFETDFPGKPENVEIMSWLPQRDVLAHPNVILFITHGGLLGKIEAVYNGVPILGLPVFWDQKMNINAAVRQGFALGIPFPELTEENFGWAVNELIYNHKYRENVKMRSRIMKDQPVKQIDEAMFWIEYVIRHKGAPHYRSPALSLKWYQRLLLDVISIVVITVSIIFLIIVYLSLVLCSAYKAAVKKRKRE